ncbi:MAG: hypothetical protein LBV68_08095 [Spirochaetaceae bacterium]|jgi:serine/threonine protein kinase|nr:hypothetical protein [Spirochaetaceae bacterium]
MAEFTPGTRISLMYGKIAEVVRKLGEGGQGIVYEVKVDGKPYALKWYTCDFPRREAFIKNMKEKIIQLGAPDEKFLWPLYFAEEQQGSFGYVMNLRPREYSDFADFLNAYIRFPSLQTRIATALNLVTAFRSLHKKGFSYQDLNDGNFFINMNTGDVLICDNDNVTPGNAKNAGQVGGKPGYMAPEVVIGNSNPNTLTDYYSLAVILFKLFIMHDPIMGALYVKLTEKDTLPIVEMELYGKNPVFIFDPNDTRNKPVKEIHKNPINLWPLYPKLFQDAFIRSFVTGVKDPNARLPENVWQETLIRIRDDLSICPKCKNEFFWSDKDTTGCDCGAVYPAPSCICVGPFRVPIFPGQKVYACHTTNVKDEYTAITGEIVTSKKDATQFGLRNFSDDSWTYLSEQGETKIAAKGNVIPLNLVKTIEFKKVVGKISDGKNEPSQGLCLFVKNYQVPLSGGQKLYACHTLAASDDRSAITGEITTNKKNPNLLGIRNLSDDEWTFTASTGEKKSIKKGEVIPIPEDTGSGILVNFRDIIGKIAVI